MRRRLGEAGVLRSLGRAASGCAVAPLVLLVLASAGHAQPSDGRVGAGSAEGAGGSWIQAPVAVVATWGAPLTALSIGGGDLTCVQSPIALDAAGRAGVLAPQVGATIIRGSSAPSPSVTWVVLPANGVTGAGGTVTVCVPGR
ncbi:MAG: hypothetical protein ACXW25_11940 [Rhodospirillales bacterium]